MTDDKTNSKPPRRDVIAAFEAKLDAFGADLGRWPQADRREAASTSVQDDPKARRQLAEARALDALLSRSTPMDDPQRLASLEDLIIAAAVAEHASRHSSGGNVVPMRIPSPDHVRPSSVPAAADASQRKKWHERSGWRPAAMLAASLFAGVVIGITEPAQTTARSVLAAVEPQSARESGDLAAAIQADTIDPEDTL